MAKQVYTDFTQNALYAEIGTYEEHKTLYFCCRNWEQFKQSYWLCPCNNILRPGIYENKDTVKIYDHLLEQDVSIKYTHTKLNINKFSKINVLGKQETEIIIGMQWNP